MPLAAYGVEVVHHGGERAVPRGYLVRREVDKLLYGRVKAAPRQVIEVYCALLLVLLQHFVRLQGVTVKAFTEYPVAEKPLYRLVVELSAGIYLVAHPEALANEEHTVGGVAENARRVGVNQRHILVGRVKAYAAPQPVDIGIQIFERRAPRAYGGGVSFYQCAERLVGYQHLSCGGYLHLVNALEPALALAVKGRYRINAVAPKFNSVWVLRVGREKVENAAS